MKDIRIEKVTLNIGCGTDTPLDHAKKILEQLSKRKTVFTRTKKRSPFGTAKGKEIGCKVTVRKEAKELLMRLLEAKGKKLKGKNFDSTGNFAFGLEEYIDIKGMEYDPKIGIIGMDVCVTLERPGYRVKRKKRAKKIGKKHVIQKEDAITFAKKELGVQVE